MTRYVIPPPAQACVAVAGAAERFPIRRVFCVGRNYAAHAREMGKDPDREPPFFFSKPADAVVPASGVVAFPPLTRDFHHEIELVVAIGKAAVNIVPEKALDVVWGYGVGVDLTRRDLQSQAKDMGRPWDWGKGFDASAPCGPLYPVSKVSHPSEGRIWLSVNGKVRQDGNLNELIWSVAEVITYVSQSMALAPGDLIYTGTPAGVGAMQPGDKIAGGIDGLGEIAFELSRKPA